MDMLPQGEREKFDASNGITLSHQRQEAKVLRIGQDLTPEQAEAEVYLPSATTIDDQISDAHAAGDDELAARLEGVRLTWNVSEEVRRMLVVTGRVKLVSPSGFNMRLAGEADAPDGLGVHALNVGLFDKQEVQRLTILTDRHTPILAMNGHTLTYFTEDQEQVRTQVMPIWTKLNARNGIEVFTFNPEEVRASLDLVAAQLGGNCWSGDEEPARPQVESSIAKLIRELMEDKDTN